MKEEEDLLKFITKEKQLKIKDKINILNCLMRDIGEKKKKYDIQYNSRYCIFFPKECEKIEENSLLIEYINKNLKNNFFRTSCYTQKANVPEIRTRWYPETWIFSEGSDNILTELGQLVCVLKEESNCISGYHFIKKCIEDNKLK